MLAPQYLNSTLPYLTDLWTSQKDFKDPSASLLSQDWFLFVMLLCIRMISKEIDFFAVVGRELPGTPDRAEVW